MKKSAVVDALKKASQGLQYLSETDAHFEAFEWPGEQGKPDKARVLELAGLPANTPVKTKPLDAFFEEAAEEKDWMDDSEQAEVERFKHLVQTIRELLKDVKVFLVGRGAEKEALVVGRTESGWAGLRTKVVET